MDHSGQYYSQFVSLLVIKKIEDKPKYWHQFLWINDNK